MVFKEVISLFLYVMLESRITGGSGIKDLDGFTAYTDLGNATVLDYTIDSKVICSGLTKMVRLQNLFHDGGSSNMGVRKEVMEVFMEK